jgi:2-methylcitrate dehydratase PrpD
VTHHYTAGLAEFIAGLQFEDIPGSVVERVKLLTLDAIGCGLLGAEMPWSERLRATLGEMEAPGDALVWGTDSRFSAPSAAMANGTAVHGFELDDVSHGGHHGSVVLTAGLAIADHEGGVSGRDLITAMVAGVEAAGRVQSCVGRVPQVVMGFHGPGLIGTFGATASASRALGLGPQQVVDALGHAGQQTGGLMATHHGGMGKRLLAGKAAHSGTLSALLAANGFTNVPNIFECEYGGFCSTFTGGRDYRPDELVKDLRKAWYSSELNFKMWACRVPIHPTLEALRSLRQEHDLSPNRWSGCASGWTTGLTRRSAAPGSRRPPPLPSSTCRTAPRCSCSKATPSSISSPRKSWPIRQCWTWPVGSRSSTTRTWMPSGPSSAGRGSRSS